MTDDATAAAKAEAAVIAAGEAARTAAGPLLHRPAADLDQALRSMADRLTERAGVVLAANKLDVEAATAAGLAAGFVDRLALDETRIGAMADQLRTLADVPAEPARTRLRDLPGDLELHERRRPVGVVGANFEARPNVVVDVASQLIKSRNAGVLRTGSSAIRSAAALIDDVVWPAMRDSGLDPAAIQLLRVRRPGQRVRARPAAPAGAAGHPARQR